MVTALGNVFDEEKNIIQTTFLGSILDEEINTSKYAGQDKMDYENPVHFAQPSCPGISRHVYFSPRIGPMH